jgi:copper chaperone
MVPQHIPLTRIQNKMMTQPHPNATRNYTVSGMTCSHCVMSVREEVSEVDGVAAVDVDLSSGRLTVSGAGFADDAVANAVAEAGYEVVS